MTAGLKNFFNQEKGFTLLELLVVIAILTTIAYMTLGNVVNDTNQIRYDDTNNRLEAIRTAIIGHTGRVMWDHGVLSGYVTDNGRLPGSINDLVNDEKDINTGTVKGFVDFGGQTVEWEEGSYVFDDSTDNDFDYTGSGAGTVPLKFPNRFLLKGYKGTYLSNHSTGKLDPDGPGGPNDPVKREYYPDGWKTTTPGNGPGAISDCPEPSGSGNSDFDDNHGWCFDSSVAETLTILSYGLDGQVDQTDGTTLTDDPYEADQSIEIEKNDWKVNISGKKIHVSVQRNIEIENRFSGTVKIGAALVAYKNQPSGAGADWDLYKTETQEIDFTDFNSILQFSSEDVNSNSLQDDGYKFVEGKELDLEFDNDESVPAGEHLLILFIEHGSPLETIPGFLVNTTAVTDNVPEKIAIYTKKVKFFPGGGPPDMTLVIN